MAETETTLKDIHDQITMFMEVAASKEDLSKMKIEIKEEIVKLKTELKIEINIARDAVLVHADRKSIDAIIEFGKKINNHKERNKGFKEKLVSVMRNNDLASKQEVKGLAQAI